MDRDELEHLLWVQGGVVSRRQLRAIGARDQDLRRTLRRGDLTRVYDGLYVNHTGQLTWEQRAWAAVLLHWPAALTRESALPDPPRHSPIQVAIDVRRSVTQVPGVKAHRTPDLAARVLWLKCPPRMTLEHAVIDVAADLEDPAEMFRTFADVCQTRLTSAGAIADTLRSRPRVRGKPLLFDLLSDLAAGACSVLERGYLHRVEKAHGLPAGRRQERAKSDGRVTERDVEYVGFGPVSRAGRAALPRQRGGAESRRRT